MKCNRWDQLCAFEGYISQQLLFDEQKAPYNALQLILQDAGCPPITPVSGCIGISISLLMVTISSQGIRENLLEMTPLMAMSAYLSSFSCLFMQQEWDVCFCFLFCFRNISVVEVKRYCSKKMKVFQTESLCLILPMKAKTSCFQGNVFSFFAYSVFN